VAPTPVTDDEIVFPTGPVLRLTASDTVTVDGIVVEVLDLDQARTALLAAGLTESADSPTKLMFGLLYWQLVLPETTTAASPTPAPSSSSGASSSRAAAGSLFALAGTILGTAFFY